MENNLYNQNDNTNLVQETNTSSNTNSSEVEKLSKNKKMISIILIIICIFCFILIISKLINIKKDPFSMGVDSIYNISKSSLVVYGTVDSGKISVGDSIQIIGMDKKITNTKVAGIEKVRESVDTATVGDYIGILLKNVVIEDIKVGQVVATPKSIKEVKKFDADVYVYTENEGGRQTPFFAGYSPYFKFNTSEVRGKIILPDNVEKVIPGDKLKFTVELESSIAMKKGTEFLIKEGGRTVGKGTVIKMY